MKRLLLLCAMFLVCGIAVPDARAATSVSEGAIIKTANNPDVYIVKYFNGRWYKRLVLNPLVFQSYGHLKWENLLVIPDSEMNTYIISDLVRVDGTNDIYQLVPEGDNGGKYLLTSLDGYDRDSVYTINSVDFGNYAMRGNKAAPYIQEINTENGKLKISSNMPIKSLLINAKEEDMPLSSLDLSTWYGLDAPKYMLADTDSYDKETLDLMSKTYYLGTRIIELQDLQKLYIKAELSDGTVAYAKNFKVAKIDGKWQLSCEHDGIYLAMISDEKTENRVYNWTQDTQDIIPDTFQNKEFGFYVYIYMGK